MILTIGFLLVLDVAVLVQGQGMNSRRCSTDRMRDCRDSISRSIQKRINEMSRQDMNQHCGVVRDDFNCLLRETRCLSSQSERQNNGDIIRKGMNYIRDGCDTSGAGWKDSSCYNNDGMRNCERDYPMNTGQFSYNDPETCRKYNKFQECVWNVLKNRCTPEDEKFIGQYLVTKAQELAWNCDDKDSDRYADRDRDRDRNYNRERDYDRRGGGYSDRDRGRDGYRSQSDYDTDRYGRRDHQSSGEITCCRNERCSTSRLDECRSSLTRTVDNRNGGYQDEKKCRRARDDFNCLLWQTSCLPREDRDRYNDIFVRARDFISRYCDTYSRWSENSCYKSSEMQRCETFLSNARGGANYESCRAFSSFRECMDDELRRRCTTEDDLLQGAYLVDKAQEMSWQCGNDNSQSSSRQNYPYSDRDRDRDRDRGDRRYDDRYDRPSYGSYEDPQHLDANDEMCLAKMQSSADNCRQVMNDKRRRLYSESDYNSRERKKCCSAIEMRRCLFDASRRMCSQERGRVVESLLGRQKYEINSDGCRGIYDSDCSSASVLKISITLLLLALSVLFSR